MAARSVVRSSEDCAETTAIESATAPKAAAATTAAAESLAHNNDEKCMALSAMACNEDNDLVDRCDNEGNRGGVDDNDDVLAGARRQQGARGVNRRRQGRHRP